MKSPIKARLFSICLLVSCLVLTSQPNHQFLPPYKYVSTKGDDNNNGNSATSPYRTIQKALDEALPGMVIQVLPGTYQERLKWINSGLENREIVLRSARGRVFLDGGGDSSQKPIIHIENQSHLVIEGIHLQNIYGAGMTGIHMSGSGASITIKNCHFFNIGASRQVSDKMTPSKPHFTFPLLVEGSDDANAIQAVTLKNNLFYDCQSDLGGAITILGNVNGFLVFQNEIKNNLSTGLFIGDHITGLPNHLGDTPPRNGVVLDNQIYNCSIGRLKNPQHSGILINGGRKISVERNRIAKNKNGVLIRKTWEGEGPEQEVQVKNNWLFFNGGPGLIIDGGKKNLIRNCHIVNNTFYHNNSNGSKGGEIFLKHQQNSLIQQNIIVPDPSCMSIISVGQPFTKTTSIRYNLFWRTTGNRQSSSYYSSTLKVEHAVFGDPLFRSLEKEAVDLHLQPGSMAINAGDPNYIPANKELDIDGKQRLKGKCIDIGAQEME